MIKQKKGGGGRKKEENDKIQLLSHKETKELKNC